MSNLQKALKKLARGENNKDHPLRPQDDKAIIEDMRLVISGLHADIRSQDHAMAELNSELDDLEDEMHAQAEEIWALIDQHYGRKVVDAFKLALKIQKAHKYTRNDMTLSGAKKK